MKMKDVIIKSLVTGCMTTLGSLLMKDLYNKLKQINNKSEQKA